MPTEPNRSLIHAGMDVHVDLKMTAGINCRPNPATAKPCRVIEPGTASVVVEGAGVPRQFVNHVRIVECFPSLVDQLPKQGAAK